MKASHKSRQYATPGSFQPDPLTPEQDAAITLLLEGRTDQEVADIINRDRATVWRWKTRIPFFMATLEAKRQEVFGVALQRLRNLLSRAIDNIQGSIEDGDVKSSFELVKATGLWAAAPPTGETNVRILAEQICLEVLAREHIPESSFDLSHLDKNPRYEERKREILEELGRTDLIS
jgi:DNA-binding CsgD family transcriptional regulator